MALDPLLIRQAAEVLAAARLLAVSSGAGMSRESGLMTFREAQTGLWAQYDPQQLATPQAFRRDPDLVWSWYMMRLQRVREAQPNPGHYAVAELEHLIPQVVVLTQNVDGLHERAGSTDIVELHGRLGRFKCGTGCQGEPTPIDLAVIDHDAEHAPRCPQCGDYVRPDVVWFGENLPRGAVERAFQIAGACDVMLVVGTSGMVQPAASLPVAARRAGATVIEVNPEPSQITPLADVFLQGPSGEVLPQIVAAVWARREPSA